MLMLVVMVLVLQTQIRACEGNGSCTGGERAATRGGEDKKRGVGGGEERGEEEEIGGEEEVGEVGETEREGDREGETER